MGYLPRDYQHDAINAALNFYNDRKVENGILVCPTGSGKSLIIANIASKLQGQILVLQPSKEILKQNFEKYISYGFRAGIYSASAGEKHLEHVTFATIGSIAKKHHLFRKVSAILIDECHLVNASDGMYRDFIKAYPKVKVVGLTATPYRLASSEGGAELRWLTRTSPRIFNKVLYYIQNNVLFDQGFLAPLDYYSFNLVDRTRLATNSSGTDFTESSLRSYYREISMNKKTIGYANRLLTKRRNLLVFCSLISEATEVAAGIPGAVVVSGDTDPATRDRLLKAFKKGEIRCIVNVGVLTTGFDYPELECVLICRSTMSLALYYQIVGRVMRPYVYKEDKVFRFSDGTTLIRKKGEIKSGWVVDLGGNIEMFGKIETMKIKQDDRGLYSIWNCINGFHRQLTNMPFRKAA